MNATRNPDKADDRIKAVINAVGSDEYSRGNWQSAGILIPETMIDRILSITPEADFITPRCTRIPMGTSSVKIPARVDKDHSTSVTGGTRVFRTKETATVEKTKDKFEMVAMEANEIVGEAAATRQLMRESHLHSSID
jgi:HK97 family phage major capsid protein